MGIGLLVILFVVAWEWLAHRLAWRKSWTFLERYGVGVFGPNTALSWALWLIVADDRQALVLIGLLWLAYVAAGAATWANYKVRGLSNPPSAARTEAPTIDTTLEKLERELGDLRQPPAGA